MRYSQQIPGQQVSGSFAFFPVAIEIQLRIFINKVASLYGVAGLGGPFLLGMMIDTNTQARGLYPDYSVPQATVVRGQIQPGLLTFPVMAAYDFGDIDPILRPLCDQVHQCFGEEASPSFDSGGKWKRA